MLITRLLITVSLAAVVALTVAAPSRAQKIEAAQKRDLQQKAPPRIAFTRMREQVDRPGSDYRLEAEIWMMNSDGTDPVRLTRNTTDDLGAVWSPDGKTIAFYGVQFTADSRGQLTAGPPHIFLIDMETRTQRPLLTENGTEVRGRFPSWSPDGQTIAFDTAGPTSSIAVINRDGSGLKQLTKENTVRSTRPDWSPDGKKIAFARGANGDEQIYVMTADGSNVVRLTDPNRGGNANAPDWSPDGRRIVFQSNRDDTSPADQPRTHEIYVMNADGSDERRLTRHALQDVDPDWSPDGLMIAFERGIEPRKIDQVFVMTADGGEPSPLTALPSGNGHPAWERYR